MTSAVQSSNVGLGEAAESAGETHKITRRVYGPRPGAFGFFALDKISACQLVFMDHY